jgi:hypothetical protein
MSPSPRSVAQADISDLTLRAAALQSNAKSGICQSILMLDIAVQHARVLAKQVRDPVAKQRFNAHVATIEELLQMARDAASCL